MLKSPFGKRFASSDLSAPGHPLCPDRTRPVAIPRKGDTTVPSYELVFIVQPTIEEEPRAALVEKITQTISKLDGQVGQVDPWGKRRLAYPIKKHLAGFYYLMYVNLPASAIRSLEQSLKLMEDVIRHLIVRTDEASA